MASPRCNPREWRNLIGFNSPTRPLPKLIFCRHSAPGHRIRAIISGCDIMMAEPRKSGGGNYKDRMDVKHLSPDVECARREAERQAAGG